MCLICKDFALGKLTIPEAYRNLRETYSETDKYSNEVWLKLIEAEKEKTSLNYTS